MMVLVPPGDTIPCPAQPKVLAQMTNLLNPLRLGGLGAQCLPARSSHCPQETTKPRALENGTLLLTRHSAFPFSPLPSE